MKVEVILEHKKNKNSKEIVEVFEGNNPSDINHQIKQKYPRHRVLSRMTLR